MRSLMILMLLVSPALAGAQARVFRLAEAGHVLPYGETAKFDFTPAGEFRSARLSLSVRMDCPQAAGSTHVMRLALNGRGITGASRVLRRGCSTSP